jgi:hypothetical protein
MTKNLKRLFILAAISLYSINLHAQSFDLSTLDNITSLINKNDNKKAIGLMEGVLGGIKSEVGNSNTGFGQKILSQVGSLASMIPALKAGNGNVNLITKAISTIKTLIAANRLKNMLGQGSLLGKSSELSSNVGILQQGLGMLQGGSKVDKISKLLNVVNKKSPKLENSGLFANLASKAVSKKLDSSLDLLSGLL